MHDILKCVQPFIIYKARVSVILKAGKKTMKKIQPKTKASNLIYFGEYRVSILKESLIRIEQEPKG